jgi:hypothetical protein
LTDITFARGSVFLERAPAVSHFFSNTTLAVKISAIFAGATNAKFRQGQLLGTNRAMFARINPCFGHFWGSNLNTTVFESRLKETLRAKPGL